MPKYQRRNNMGRRFRKLLFVIPIYFQTIDKNRRNMEDRRAKFVTEMLRMPHRLDRSYYIAEFNRSDWLTWRYTQVVGFIEIVYVDGNIKASYYFVDRERLSPNMRHRRFKYIGRLGDVSLRIARKRNDVIRREVKCFLNRLPGLRDKFRNRYFDTELVETLLPLLDFRRLRNTRTP